MGKRARRALARMVYRTHPVCFACGRPGDAACPGHEYGGVLHGWTTRPLVRLTPLRWTYWIDPNWTLTDTTRGASK